METIDVKTFAESTKTVAKFAEQTSDVYKEHGDLLKTINEELGIRIKKESLAAEKSDDLFKTMQKIRDIQADINKQIEFREDISKNFELSRQKKEKEIEDAIKEGNNDKQKNLEEEIKNLTTIAIAKSKQSSDDQYNFSKQIETLKEIKSKQEEAYKIEKLKEISAKTMNFLQEGGISSLKNIAKLGGEGAGAFGEMAGSLGQYAKYVGEIGPEGAVLAVGVALLVAYLKMSIDRFMLLQKSAEDFRIETGLTISESKILTEQAEKLNRQYQQFGITAKMAYESIGAAVEQVGSALVVNNLKDITEASALLKANYGVAAKDSIGFMLNMMRVGGVSESGAASMAAYAVYLSRAAGVPLSKVMKEVAGASGETLAMVRGSSIELIKATVAADRLGVTLNDSGKSSRGLLNFYDSVNAEMEAGVLLGKNVNFQHARELAWLGNIEGAQSEILRVIQGAGDFSKMNVFQQEALAKVSGYSIEQLQKMIQNKKMLNRLSSEERSRYDEINKQIEDRAEMTDTDIMQQKEMQSIVSNISNSFTKLGIVITDRLGPALNKIAEVISFIADYLGKTDKGFDDVNAQVDGLYVNRPQPTFWEKFTDSLKMGPWQKLSGPQYYKMEDGRYFNMGRGIGGAISEGIDSTGPDMEASITGHLNEAASNNDAVGNSPSKLGLSIVDGIESVGGMISNALIDPFESVGTQLYNFIVDPFISGIDYIIDHVKDIPSILTGGLIGSPTTADVNSPTATAQQGITNEDNSDKIVAKLDELLNQLKNGGIAVYLDGRQVNKQLAG